MVGNIEVVPDYAAAIVEAPAVESNIIVEQQYVVYELKLAILILF